MGLFKDRRDAGLRLSDALADHGVRPGADTVVLALPRGGVPVAFPVAQILHAPLDVFLVRKLGAPEQPELAMGAIASGGVRVMNDQVVQTLQVTPEAIERVVDREQHELARREDAYRDGSEPVAVGGRTCLLIDDGLATGASMAAAVKGLRQRDPEKILVAVPVGSDEACDLLAEQADEVICLERPRPFFGVGAWYDDFGQTSDEEVRDLLRRALNAPPPHQR